MRCVHEQTRTGSHELIHNILTPETNLADHSMMQRGVRLYIAACYVRGRMKTITGYQGRGRAAAAACGLQAGELLRSQMASGGANHYHKPLVTFGKTMEEHRLLFSFTNKPPGTSSYTRSRALIEPKIPQAHPQVDGSMRPYMVQ